jgi:hypothetical protein
MCADPAETYKGKVFVMRDYLNRHTRMFTINNNKKG